MACACPFEDLAFQDPERICGLDRAIWKGILAAFVVMRWQGLNANIMSLGGIAVAVRAAREGLNVLLVNRNRHLGGILSSGLRVWDTLYEGKRSPIYDEARQNIFDYYRETYGERSAQYRRCLPGKAAGIPFGNETLGHRLNPGPVVFTDEASWLEGLREHHVEADLAARASELERDFQLRLSDVEKVLLDFERRGNAFFDERLRLMRLHELLSKERLRKDFETTVVADLPRQVEKRVEATPDTMYALASTSKTLTATGIMVLVERGLVIIEKDTLIIPDVEALELEAER